MSSVRIAAAQTPDFIDDVPASLAYAAGVARQAADARAALVCFPEAFVQGYRTDAAFVAKAAIQLEDAAFREVLDRLPEGPMIILGLIEADGGAHYNTAVVIKDHALLGRYRKAHLLAGETAFAAGEDAPVFDADGLRFGVNICHDTNFPQAALRPVAAGASLIVCPANNMMRRENALMWKDRHNAARSERCRETGAWLISSDVTGERDGRLALGPTAVIDPAGEVRAQLPLRAPGLLVFDLPVIGAVS